jgi:Tol biopolymer transport system component
MQHPPDFDLEIEVAGAGYTVQVLAAFGVGELPPQPFALPLDLAQLPHDRSDVAGYIAQARVTRLSGNQELLHARELGGALFDHLFTREVLACFTESRAKLAPNQILRLRLRLPPALVSLPWELLYDRRKDEFLALAPDLTLVRYPELPTPIAPLQTEGALQIVAVLASPQGYRPIKLEREQRRIELALKQPLEAGQIALDIIRGPDTLGQLRARLRRPVHVLHILCHGDIDEVRGEGVLIFEDADGVSEKVSAELLRLQLQKQRGQTRLVMLNACLGALPPNDSPFSSVAAALLRGGVPAVIAMQFEIAEDTASELTRVFYAELAAGTPVDLAVNEARLHLYGYDSFRLDWVIPVLFMRSENGALFEVAQAPTAKPALPTPILAAPLPAPALPKSRFSPPPWVWLALVILLMLLVLSQPLGRILSTMRISISSEIGPTSAAIAPTLATEPGLPAGPTSAPEMQTTATALAATGLTQTLAAATALAAPTQTMAAAAIPANSTPAPPATTIAAIEPATAVPAIEQIAFSSYQGNSIMISIMNNDGGGLRTIQLEGNANNPTWSPDGKRIAFELKRDNISDIYIANIDGSGLMNLTADAANDGDPAWAPDGTSIAFVKFDNQTRKNEIYTIGVDGQNQQKRTRTSSQSDEFPAWSPDGQQIAFASKQNNHYDLYVLSLVGKPLIRLTDTPNTDETAPAWSPNRQTIAFAAKTEGVGQIWTINVNGEARTQLTDTNAIDESPTWSPDGKRIAFDSNRERGYKIWVMNADGTGLRRLTDDPTSNEGDVAWWPTK